MSYDYDRALIEIANLVKGAYTQEDLLNLAKQVDITAEGTVTVLYRAVGCGEARTASIANDAVSSSSYPTDYAGCGLFSLE
jgi:aromatic ring hydroxylase